VSSLDRIFDGARRTDGRTREAPWLRWGASEQRGVELKSLLNQGLITQSQYQAESQKVLN